MIVSLIISKRFQITASNEEKVEENNRLFWKKMEKNVQKPLGIQILQQIIQVIFMTFS